ncbi:MAG: iron ABC transporter permease [Methanoculleus sp. SDB]|nr:MAG: iron ABC transporter permease [Methanoculleus sp. SDB]
MHLADGEIPAAYRAYTGRKISWCIGGILLLILLLVVSISVGACRIPVDDVVRALVGFETLPKWRVIVWNIRLPQALTAVVAGAGLAVSGAAMQSILRNPLGSPFTLGISHAAAFGAAFSVIVLGTGTMHSTGADAVVLDNPYITTIIAFLFCMIATGIILLIANIRGASPEVMVLAGVAIGSLFTAGTMFLQYFADDVQLAAVVFWTFGDVGRADWSELGLLSVVTLAAIIYFTCHRWNYNAIDAGDETAKGLGVRVERVRLFGMLAASLVTAVTIAFLGIIGFVGLVCPHMVRRVIGDDHRFLIPGSCIAGGVLLLASDTAARLMLAPHILPVAILTAFLGAPVFIWLLLRGYRR